MECVPPFLGTSGVFLPDLLPRLLSHFLSFLDPPLSEGVSPFTLGVDGIGLGAPEAEADCGLAVAVGSGGVVAALGLLTKCGGRNFSEGAGGAGVGCLVGG